MTHVKDLYPDVTAEKEHFYECLVGNRLNTLLVNAQTLFYYKDGMTATAVVVLFSRKLHY